MPVEGTSVFPLSWEWILFIFRVMILVFALLYLIFSVVVMRQINLMTETIITELSPYLRFFGVVYVGVSAGLILLFFGLLLR